MRPSSLNLTVRGLSAHARTPALALARAAQPGGALRVLLQVFKDWHVRPPSNSLRISGPERSSRSVGPRARIPRPHRWPSAPAPTIRVSESPTASVRIARRGRRQGTGSGSQRAHVQRVPRGKGIVTLAGEGDPVDMPGTVCGQGGSGEHDFMPWGISEAVDRDQKCMIAGSPQRLADLLGLRPIRR